LFDEDRCATNFMIRDDVMRKLVKSEPITPLIERVRSLLLGIDGRFGGCTSIAAYLQFSSLEDVQII
jgi:predicted ABC-class ATPase